VGEIIFEQASEAIVVASADGVVTAWNAAAERMHGIAASDAIGRQIDELIAVRSIEGVALAPNQLDFTNTPDSGTDVHTNGGVFFHGVNLGLEARW
jgi:PAS domain S-box-containing protein